MNASMADPNEPNLCVGTAREQAIGGLKRLIGDLEFTGFYVDGNDPTVVAGFDLGTNSLLIDFRSKASVFFFGETWLPDCHGVSPFLDCEGDGCILHQNRRAVRSVSCPGYGVPQKDFARPDRFRALVGPEGIAAADRGDEAAVGTVRYSEHPGRVPFERK